MSYIAQSINLVRGVAFNFMQVLMGNATTNAYAHFDGELCYFFAIPYNTTRVTCLVFNPVTLQGCFYSNLPNNIEIDSMNQAGSFVRYLGKRLFLCNDGNGHTTYFQIPQLFINNGYIQVSSQTFTAQPPCGQGVIGATYYDAATETLAVIFNKNFGTDYDSWVSIYKTNGSSLTFITGGYLGNFPTASDSFAQSTFDFPTKYANPGCNGAALYGFQSNGMTQFSQVRNYPNPYYFGGGNSRIAYGGLQCGIANKGQSFSYFSDTFLQPYTQLPGGTYSNSFGTNLPGCVAFGSNNNNYVLGNAKYGLQFNVTNIGLSYQGMCYIGGGGFVFMEWTISFPKNWVITMLQSQTPFVDPVLPPNVTPQTSSLLNWHRPISTRGLFKT